MDFSKLTPELVAAIVGGITGFITALAGALIAISNSHTVRSWMNQKGSFKKAELELIEKELNLKYKKFDDIISKYEEEVKILKLKIEAIELNAQKERSIYLDKIENLNNQIISLSSKAASASSEVKVLHKRQDENIKRIESLEKSKDKLTEENISLKEILKRGGSL